MLPTADFGRIVSGYIKSATCTQNPGKSAKSHRRASEGAPHLHVSVREPSLCQNGLHATLGYKREERRWRKGWHFRNQKGEKAGRLKVNKKQERKFREFFFFIFCLRETEREHCNRRGRFSFVIKKGKRVSREGKLSLKACFHHWRERLRCRGPPWSFFSFIYICIFTHSSDRFHEWNKCLIDNLLLLFPFNTVRLMLSVY